MDGFHGMSLAQAADLLTARVLVKQASPPTPPAAAPPATDPGISERIKQLLGKVDLSALVGKGADAAKSFSPTSNPLHAALLGSGVGAGAGALGALTSSDKEKRKRWLRNMLFGGAMGGIGGGALYGMAAGGKGLAKPSAREDSILDTPQEPTLPARVSHAAGTGLPLIAATTVGGGIAGNLAGQLHDRRATMRGLSGALGTKGFSTHLNAANEAMGRASVPEVTQAQIDQFGRHSTATPLQKLLGSKTPAHAVLPPGAAGPTLPAKHVSYAKPKLLPAQEGPLIQQYRDYMSKSKNPASAKRPFGLSGRGGAILGAGVGTALSMAGAPHLSIRQQQQQAATPPSF